MATVEPSTRYILVSGGDGGIGSAVCRHLSGAGFTPIVGFRQNATQAAVMAAASGGIAVQLDLSQDWAIKRAIGELPPVAGVVFAASPPPELLPFVKLAPEHFASQFRVNVIGAHAILAELIRTHFRPRRSGVVVGVLSSAIGSPDTPPATGMGAYVVAKAALQSLLLVCAAENPWLKVRSVAPGLTRTKMLDVFDERYLQLASANRPIATPDDVARTIIHEIVT